MPASPDIEVHKLDRDLVAIRVYDRGTRYFEALWEIPEGINYNSYVLLTNEGAVLFDTVKAEYSEEYVGALREVVDLRDIKYLVVHHMEPDHSGAIPELFKYANPVVIGHALAKDMLTSFYGIQPAFIKAQDGASIKLGGLEVKFYHVPWLHWPETIMSYVEGRGALFTCDAFGSYGVFNARYLDEMEGEAREKYLRLARKYFANVIGTYREWVVKGLQKLSSIGIRISEIHPSHGVSVRGPDVQMMLDKYGKWGRGDPEKGKTVLIYSSMYNFVERAVGIVKEYLESRGIPYSAYAFTDTSRDNISDAVGDAFDAEYLVLATSTYEASMFPLFKYILQLLAKKAPANKKVLFLGVYGWGGRAAAEFVELMKAPASLSKFEALEFKAGEEAKHRDEIIKKLEELFGNR